MSSDLEDIDCLSVTKPKEKVKKQSENQESKKSLYILTNMMFWAHQLIHYNIHFIR